MEYNDYLIGLASQRQEADYESSGLITEENARIGLQRAEEFFHYVQEKYAP